MGYRIFKLCWTSNLFPINDYRGIQISKVPSLSWTLRFQPNFSTSPAILRTNFRFPRRLEKSRFHSHPWSGIFSRESKRIRMLFSSVYLPNGNKTDLKPWAILWPQVWVTIIEYWLRVSCNTLADVNCCFQVSKASAESHCGSPLLIHTVGDAYLMLTVGKNHNSCRRM